MTGTLLNWSPPELSHAYVHYLLHCLFATYMVEGCLANQQLVGQHSDAPQVHSVVVVSSRQYLRCRVVEGATVGLAPFVADGGPAEVAELADLIGEDDVLGFDVPVGYSLVVEVLDGLGDVVDLGGCLLLREGLGLLHLAEESALLHVFQDEVDVLFVVEAAVYFKDVLMVAETLDLHF